MQLLEAEALVTRVKATTLVKVLMDLNQNLQYPSLKILFPLLCRDNSINSFQLKMIKFHFKGSSVSFSFINQTFLLIIINHFLIIIILLVISNIGFSLTS